MSVDARVVLIPVAVSKPAKSPVPYLVGLRAATGDATQGVWANASMLKDPRTVANDLLTSILGDADLRGLAELLEIDSSSLQPVEFVDRGKQLVLIYTLSLPTGWTDVPSLSDRWVRLCGTEPTRNVAKDLGRMQIADERTAPYAELVLDHWRQLLEETPAVLSFLAPFFTLAQVRDVYSAVWGYEQDATHWGTWANRNLEGFAYEPVDPADVREGFRQLLNQPQWPDLSGMAAEASAPLIEGPHQDRWTGTSREALGTVAASLIPGAALGALTSAVAHQVVKPRGNPSQWSRALLSRTDLYDPWGIPRTKLKSVYSPRPTWQYAGELSSTNKKPASNPSRSKGVRRRREVRR